MASSVLSLTLYIGNKRYSSWSLRPWLFLKHHGLPFSEERVKLDTDEMKTKLAGVSPTFARACARGWRRDLAAARVG